MPRGMFRDSIKLLNDNLDNISVSYSLCLSGLLRIQLATKQWLSGIALCEYARANSSLILPDQGKKFPA